MIPVLASAQAPRSMSFQGYLTDALGVVVNSPQTLTLKLFHAGAGGSSIWSRTYADVPVNNGLFDIILENGTPSFSNLAFVDSLWIQLEVDVEVVSPRTRVTASAYARGLSLPVEAEVDLAGTALKITNTLVSGEATALYGTVRSTSGQGVYGSATRTTGSSAYGVHGKNAGSSGRAVFGWATSISGSGIGVAGQTSSESGVGVLGLATHSSGVNSGVRGQTSSTSGWGGHFTGGQGTYTRGADNSGPDLVLGGTANNASSGRIFSDTAYVGSDIYIQSNDFVTIQLDRDGSGEDADFYVADKDNNWLFNVDESGAVAVRNSGLSTTFSVSANGVVNVADSLIVANSISAGGAIVHSSDRNRKDNIAPVNTGQILEDVVRLPISQWRYKGRLDTHMGPMAQDFYSAFNLGSDETGIATVDADGVALAAIQGLYELVQEQQAQIERMQMAMERAGIE